VEKDGQIRAPGIAHADPTRRELLRGLLRRFPVEPGGPHPAVVALRTGEPQLLPRVPPELLEALSTHPEHLEMLRALGLASAMAVPMRARGHTVGAISFGRTGGVPYDEADLEVAQELARRAALAVDNALLHEQARAAVRAREEVLAVVSHDLRNPLNAVLIGATILDEFSEPDRWTERDRRQLHAIRNSAQQMATLIQDLVEVVALESGNRTLSTERVDAGALLAGVAELFREMAAQKGVRLAAQAAAGLPPVRADRARLLQVFSNLVGNALKFTPAGGAITLGSAASPPGAVVFRVSDSGPGIPADQLPRVFDRFWQAQRGEQAGMGLGLAIARGIVEAHGGRIWAESTPGAGSTFFFTVPAEED
jgi:signal transduction histidine kinase